MPPKNCNIDHNFFIYGCIVFILGHNNTWDKTFKSIIDLHSLIEIQDQVHKFLPFLPIFAILCITFLFLNGLSSYLDIILHGVDQNYLDLYL